MDISFSTLDADVAVAGIAILSYPDMRVSVVDANFRVLGCPLQLSMCCSSHVCCSSVGWMLALCVRNLSLFRSSDQRVVYLLFSVVHLLPPQILYSKCNTVRLTVPYIPGFLAFREVLHLQQVILDAMEERPDIRPQVSTVSLSLSSALVLCASVLADCWQPCPARVQIILVDGNGILHPRGLLAPL